MTTEDKNLNPQENFFYETGIDFVSQDTLNELLEMALNLSPELSFINRPWRKIAYNSTPKIIEEVVKEHGGTTRDAREFVRRRLIMARELGTPADGVSEIVIDQYRIPKRIAEPLAKEVSMLLDIPLKEIDPIVQIQKEGTLLYPHNGHARNSSIFCLLQGNGEETTWYDETEPFKMFDMYRIPDYSKLKVATIAKLQEMKWSTFNHHAWHSVARKGQPERWRVNLNIDFASLSYDDLMEKIKNVRKTSST
jgi:hypothetical protein|tara:strand:+ start:715 stop:1467 length:753 start_codon:yes stop_codon:yes gene_type:complete